MKTEKEIRNKIKKIREIELMLDVLLEDTISNLNTIREQLEELKVLEDD